MSAKHCPNCGWNHPPINPCPHCGYDHDPDCAEPYTCRICGHKFCVWWYGSGMILCPKCYSPLPMKASDLGKPMQHPFEVVIDTKAVSCDESEVVHG